MSKVLVTGGVRSGKSRYAEGLLAGVPAVTYLTPGYPADPVLDPEWAARVSAHRLRRPPSWTTVETLDISGALASAENPVLWDCVGTWVSRSVDTWDSWERPQETHRRFESTLESMVDAWLDCPQPIVAVTNEVGWGLVSEHASGRLFTDLLGTANARLAEVSDRVVLMVAGRALTV